MNNNECYIDVDCTGDPDYVGPDINVHYKYLSKLARRYNVKCIGCAYVSSVISAKFVGPHDKLKRMMKNCWDMDEDEFEAMVEEA